MDVLSFYNHYFPFQIKMVRIAANGDIIPDDDNSRRNPRQVNFMYSGLLLLYNTVLENLSITNFLLIRAIIKTMIHKVRTVIHFAF